MRISGGGPSPSQDTGRAIASPSGSVPVTWMTVTSGKVPLRRGGRGVPSPRSRRYLGHLGISGQRQSYVASREPRVRRKPTWRGQVHAAAAVDKSRRLRWMTCERPGHDRTPRTEYATAILGAYSLVPASSATGDAPAFAD